jgi:hypothetical protein
MKINEFFTSQEDSEKPRFDFDVVDDLQQFMVNDPMFYRKVYYPQMLSISKRAKADKGVAPLQDLSSMISRACNEYVNKFKLNVDPRDLLSKEDQLRLSEKIISDEQGNIQKGEL